MAVNIDEMHVETQPAAPSSAAGAPAAGGAAKPDRDLKSEMELYRERELRLQAD